MIDHIGLSVADYERSKAFYPAALAPLGYALVMEITEAGPDAGFGAGGKPDFWLGPGEATTRQVHVALAPETAPRCAPSTRRRGQPARRITARPGCGRSIIRTTTARSCSIRTDTTSKRCATSRNEPGVHRPARRCTRICGARLGSGRSSRSSASDVATRRCTRLHGTIAIAISTDATTLDRAGLAEREGVLALLRAKEVELRALGVRRLGLFGSIARGEAGPESDVDLLAEIDHSSRFSLLDLVGLQFDLEDLIGRKVEIATAAKQMRPRMRRRVEADATDGVCDRAVGVAV